jgi:DNA-directed RNA polymerase subunit RPC12/RpoP
MPRTIRTYADALADHRPEPALPVENGNVRCPNCRRRVPPDMLRDYTIRPVGSRLPRWACDACGEREVMEGRATREEFARALGQSVAAIAKAAYLDQALPGRGRV